MKSSNLELCGIPNWSQTGPESDLDRLSFTDVHLVHEIAFERRRIKEEMEKLGVKQNQILDMIEVLHMSKMATLAIKGIVSICVPLYAVYNMYFIYTGYTGSYCIFMSMYHKYS